MVNAFKESIILSDFKNHAQRLFVKFAAQISVFRVDLWIDDAPAAQIREKICAIFVQD